MGLRDLKTDYKSLRYGKDRPGGGNSKQPYVTVKAKNSFNLPIEDLSNTGGTDFTLRANTLQHVARDESRLAQLLFASGNGWKFTAKQNLLSRTAVKTQGSSFLLNEGAYIPTSTLLQAAANPFGGHLNKQGLNPFASTTEPATGFLANLTNLTGPNSYIPNLEKIKDKNSNRLVELKDKKIAYPNPKLLNSNFLDKVLRNSPLGEVFNKGNKIKDITNELFGNQTGISPYKNELLRYGGGPGSVNGIGQTAIKRYSDTNYIESAEFREKYPSVYVLNNSQISSLPNSSTYTSVQDFRNSLLDVQRRSSGNKNVISDSLEYADYNQRIEGRVNLGDPGRRNKNVSNYVKGLGEPLDKLNALPIYKSQWVTSDRTKNDLVKFRIAVIDNVDPSKKTYMHFRAFLDGFEDNYSAEWGPQSYMGRGEKFYRYGGFDRSISLSWTVAAQSKEELIPMYKKLNFLASSLAPDYSSTGYMSGNLVKLTVGGYLYEQPGIITSLNYSVPQESPWEIAIPVKSNPTTVGEEGNEILSDSSVKEMPHMIKVTGFNFIPIHEFVPRIQRNAPFGRERFIALNNGGNNNYDS